MSENYQFCYIDIAPNEIVYSTTGYKDLEDSPLIGVIDKSYVRYYEIKILV